MTTDRLAPPRKFEITLRHDHFGVPCIPFSLVRVIVRLIRGFSCARLTRPPYLFHMQVEGGKLIVKSYEVTVFVENTLRSL